MELETSFRPEPGDDIMMVLTGNSQETVVAGRLKGFERAPHGAPDRPAQGALGFENGKAVLILGLI
jgi:hypothetical protein